MIVAAIAAITAIVASSCSKSLELDNPSLNAGYGVYAMKSAKDSTNNVVPPADTTRSVQPDTTVVAPKDTLLPTRFGEPIEMGISIVAADTTGSLKPHNGKGKMEPFKAICLTFANGALVVVFEKDQIFPTIEQIKSAQFVQGKFSAYNSGYDPDENGRWLPAKASDKPFGLEYTANNSVVRSILYDTLDKWGWSEDDCSTIVDGYSYSVNNGKMTIRYKADTLILY